jgi:hypothetical protein
MEANNYVFHAEMWIHDDAPIPHGRDFYFVIDPDQQPVFLGLFGSLVAEIAQTALMAVPPLRDVTIGYRSFQRTQRYEDFLKAMTEPQRVGK